MTEIEQFSLDLDGATIESRVNLNAANDARNWTTEAMAAVWVLGQLDWDWWNSFPEYKRREWIAAYEWAQQTRRGPSACDMQTFSQYQASSEEHYKRELELVTGWAKEIREAWMNNKPCPLRAGDLVGMDLLRFEHRLSWAFSLAAMKAEQFQNEASSAE